MNTDAPSAVANDIWRTPGRDPVNSLYLFLRLHGYAEDYAEFSKQAIILGDEPSMMEIKDFAKSLGFRLDLRATTLEELIRQQEMLPAIVLSDVMGEKVGNYSLLVYVNRKQIGLVDGAMVTLDTPSRDQFLDSWTGYILTLSPSPPVWYTSLVGISGWACGIAVVSLLLSHVMKILMHPMLT